MALSSLLGWLLTAFATDASLNTVVPRRGVDLAWPPAVHGLDHQRGRQRDPAPGSRYLELTRLATTTVAGKGDDTDYGAAVDRYAIIAVAA